MKKIKCIRAYALPNGYGFYTLLISGGTPGVDARPLFSVTRYSSSGREVRWLWEMNQIHNSSLERDVDEWLVYRERYVPYT
jgi:hypothetical protein